MVPAQALEQAPIYSQVGIDLNSLIDEVRPLLTAELTARWNQSHLRVAHLGLQMDQKEHLRHSKQRNQFTNMCHLSILLRGLFTSNRRKFMCAMVEMNMPNRFPFKQ